MTVQTCPKCLGTGQVILEDGASTTCRCIALRQALSEIVRTPGLEKVRRFGPHFLPDGKPLEGRAIICARWPEARECVAGWMFHHIVRGWHPKVLVLACSDLRTLYVQNEIDSIKAYDVVVVRVLGIKNSMTPDALMVALTMGPPLWIVHSPDNTFGEGHPAWSHEIADELSDATRIDLAPTVEEYSILRILGIEKKGGRDA